MTPEEALMEILNDIEDALIYEEDYEETIYDLLQERFIIGGEPE